MDSTAAIWNLNLEQGEWFEEHVARPWILLNRPDAWVTDSRSHKRGGRGKGPRMVRGKDELVLPDFRLDDPVTGESSWLDSKVKNGPFSIEGQGWRRFHSLDPMAYVKYIDLMLTFQHMRFEILLGCAHTNVLWLFDLRGVEPVMHRFDNKHVRKGASLTPCFSTDQMRMVGRWDSTNLPR